MKSGRTNILVLILLLMSLIIAGTFGYSILLNLDFVDALYMTVITISTVGYGEVGKMNNDAKIFSVFLILISLGFVGYLFSSIVSSLLEGDIKQAWRRRNMETMIKKMKNHYIICGAGETGYNAIKQFVASNEPFVVIDKNEERINNLVSKGIPCILGDASEESILEKAIIHSAKGLISSLPSDAENVYTVLTARQMNKNIYIVSRSINKMADEKLKKAGANNTLSPNEIGGTRMASLMLRPTVISFLDIITHAGDITLDLEEVAIFASSSLINKSLKQARIPQETGLIILAIKEGTDGKMIFNPSSDTLLEKGDVMIVLGKKDQVNILRNLANDTGERVMEYLN